MVKEISTLAPERPTTLAEKRRMQKELGLEVEPPFVMPKGNARPHEAPSAWQRFARWLKGSPD